MNPFNNLIRNNLPTPLAKSIDSYCRAVEEDGVETTADELCPIIEIWFKLCGQLLVADYLSRGATDRALNRRLFQSLSKVKEPLIGQWVGLSRASHDVLKKSWSETQPPLLKGLEKLDFGMPGDHKHPVSSLIEYRNNFGHGSFMNIREDIIKHAELLEKQISILADGFNHASICGVDKDGSIIQFCGFEAMTIPYKKSQHETFTVYMETDGREVLLNPVMTMKPEGNTYHLTVGTFRSKETVDQAWLETLKIALERYKREQLGWVDLSDELLRPQVSEESRKWAGSLEIGKGISLIEVKAGSGLAETAQALSEKHDECLDWMIAENLYSLANDSTVFQQAVLRQVEKVSGFEEASLKEFAADKINEALKSNDLDLTIIVRFAGRALEMDIGKTFIESWIEVGKINGIRLILLDYCRSQTKLPYDYTVIRLEKKECSNLEEYGALIEQWHRQDPIRKNILDILHVSDSPLNRIEIRDQLQESGKSVLLPVIDRALWDAALFIEVSRDSAHDLLRYTIKYTYEKQLT